MLPPLNIISKQSAVYFILGVNSKDKDHDIEKITRLCPVQDSPVNTQKVKSVVLYL